MSCNKLNLAVLAIVVTTSSLKGQPFTYNDQVVKSYKVFPTTSVEINNKYGKVHITNWQLDSVKIVVDESLSSRSASRLSKLKNSVNFDFTGTTYFICAKTLFGGSNAQIITNMVADILTFADNKIEINYTVYVPENTNLTIEDKFGDVYMNNFTGNTFRLKLSNGNFKANAIGGNSNINIEFGSGEINSVNSGNLDVAYCDLLQIKQAGQLNISSKSSKVNIEEVKTLKAKSKNDKYFITSTGDISGNSYFSDFLVFNLGGQMVYDLKYGNLTVENIPKSFTFIKINSKYTDVKLNFEKESSYQVDITHKNSEIIYPRELARMQDQKINSSDDKQIFSFGSIGNPQATAKLSVAAEYGSVVILHK